MFTRKLHLKWSTFLYNVSALGRIETTGFRNFAPVIRHFRKKKGTGAEMRPAIDSGIVTDDAPVSYWPIFSQSLETVPEVFAKVNSANFPSGFKSGESVLHQWQ